MQANARLISAAPLLLEACLKMISEIESDEWHSEGLMQETFEEMVKAVKKAIN
jgi:hypothetical protein